MIATEFGDIGMMGYEVLQEAGELVALAEHHVTAHQVLVDHAQLVVVAEGVHVHEVPDLVALLREEHGELEGRGKGARGDESPHRTPAPIADLN